MRQVFNTLLVFALGLLLTGCTKNTVMSRDCLSNGQEVSSSTFLVASLVDKENSSVVENSEILFEDLEGLQFGMTGENTKDLYYGAYELCNLETGEYQVEGDYSKEVWNSFVKENDGSISSYGGNHTSFIYSIEDEEFNYIPGIGDYAINTYTASENGDWEWADTFEFTVIE